MMFTKRKTGKKAVAPVLATLLMIAVAVAMSVIIFMWSQGFLSQTSESTGSQQGSQNQAAQSSVAIESALFVTSDTVPSFIMSVRNVGAVAVSLGQVTISGVSSNAKFTGYIQAPVSGASLGTIVSSDSAATFTTTGTGTLNGIAKGSAATIKITVGGTVSTLKLGSGDTVTIKVTTGVGTFAQATFTVP